MNFIIGKVYKTTLGKQFKILETDVPGGVMGPVIGMGTVSGAVVSFNTDGTPRYLNLDSVGMLLPNRITKLVKVSVQVKNGEMTRVGSAFDVDAKINLVPGWHWSRPVMIEVED